MHRTGCRGEHKGQFIPSISNEMKNEFWAKSQGEKGSHNHIDQYPWTMTVVQSVRAFAPQAKGWVSESQPRQVLFVKTGSDSTTAKRSASGVSVTGLQK